MGNILSTAWYGKETHFLPPPPSRLPAHSYVIFLNINLKLDSIRLAAAHLADLRYYAPRSTRLFVSARVCVRLHMLSGFEAIKV